MSDCLPPIDNPFLAFSPADALRAINAAIAKVEQSGQEYQIGDRKLTRADVRWMYPERARLEGIVRAGLRARNRFHRVVPL